MPTRDLPAPPPDCPREPACFAEEMCAQRQARLNEGVAAALGGHMPRLDDHRDPSSAWEEGYRRVGLRRACVVQQRCVLGDHTRQLPGND